MSNLIYLAKPMSVGSKGALKGRPKIFIADAAIRSAVLMIDDVLSDEQELGAVVETTVYKHLVSFYQGSTALYTPFRPVPNRRHWRLGPRSDSKWPYAVTVQGVSELLQKLPDRRVEIVSCLTLF